MAIIAIGFFSSCSKPVDTVVMAPSGVFPVQMILDEGADEISKDITAAPCLPKSLIPVMISLDTMYRIPPVGPAGVDRLLIRMKYSNPNTSGGIVKFQIRKSNNQLVTIGPYPLPPTPFGAIGEFEIEDPSFIEGNYSLTFIRGAASIPGCPRTNFFSPAVTIVVQP